MILRFSKYDSYKTSYDFECINTNLCCNHMNYLNIGFYKVLNIYVKKLTINGCFTIITNINCYVIFDRFQNCMSNE